MTIAATLIDRLNSETGRRLVSLAQRKRQTAVAAISRFYVVITDDGRVTRETTFDRPPTLGELVDEVGPGACVVAVQMRRARAQPRSLSAE